VASGDLKSMILKLIAGIEKPDKGKIILNKRVLFDAEKKVNLSPQERHVGYLFQNYALFPNMTVEENIRISLKGSNDKKSEIVAEQIRKFHLEGLEKSYPSNISGGQQQRVAIARALINDPSIILADEPTGNLDSKTGMEIMDMFKELNIKGRTIIMITHDAGLASYADRVVYLKDGMLNS
jgi:molybdate transport system ATP-binding protein